MYDRRNHAKRLLFGGIVLGTFAALWLALVEGAFLALAGGGTRLAGARADRLIFYDVLVLLLLGPVIGLLAGTVVSGVHLLATALAPQRQQEPMWKGRAYVALSIPWAAWVAQQAFLGPRARALPYRPVLALGTGAVLLGAVWGAARIGSYVAGRLSAGHASRATRLVVAPTLLGVSVLLYCADTWILPRLYPFFHWSLAGAVLLAAWLGMGAAHLSFGRALRGRFGRLARPTWAVGVALVLLALGLVGQRRVGRSNHLRGLLFERTSAAAKVLSLSSRLGAMPAPEPLRATLPEDHPRRAPGASLRAHPGALRGADIVLITVDALRADRIGLLGYRRLVGGGKPVSITPNIDRIFGTGLVYRRAYTSTPRTSYAVVSLFTGVPMHTLLNLGVRRRWPTLPEVLSARGHYRTAGFYPKAVFTIDRARFRRYELEHLGFQFFHFEGHDMPAAKRTDQVLSYLDGPGRAARPLFLWAHYFDPHEPYRVLPGYEAFGHRARDRYDAEIAYADAQIGRLVDGVLRRRSRRVIWVLAADHGEEFGEHGGTNHGTTLYDEQARVPLLVAGPGIPSRVVDDPVSLLWVPGALVRLVGFAAPPPMGDAPPLDMESRSGRESHAAAIADLDEQHMVVEGHFKLLQNRSRHYLALYNLKADPQERHPLDIDRQGAARKRASRLLGRLEHWLRRMERLRRSSERAGSGALRLALVSSNLARRRAAAQTLLRQALAEWLQSDSAPRGRARSGSSTPLGPLQTGLLSSRPLLRALEKHLQDPDPEVRHYALATLALEQHAPASASDALLKLAHRWDLPEELALATGAVLARQGRAAATPLLVSLLGRLFSLDARTAVVRLLGDPRIASAEGLMALRLALTDWELSLDSLRAVARLARASATRVLARNALPGVVAVLRASAEHLGHRAQALRTLAAIGTPAAQALVARWIPAEPDRELRALGLALLLRWPSGQQPGASARRGSGSPWLLRLPAPFVEAPSGACLPAAGCRLEPTPTAITWPVSLPGSGRNVALFLVTESPPTRPPEITLEGERLAASPEPIFGADTTPVHARVWRVSLPAGMATRLRQAHVVRISLRDSTGRGVVIRGLAWLPIPRHAAPAPVAPKGDAPAAPKGDAPAAPKGATPTPAAPKGATPAPAAPKGAAPAAPKGATPAPAAPKGDAPRRAAPTRLVSP